MKRKVIFIIVVLAITCTACVKQNENKQSNLNPSKQSNSATLGSDSHELILDSNTENVQKVDLETARVIATSSTVCDIMDRLNIELVGVAKSGKISARYKDLPRVGISMSPDMEIIRSLKPTDVVGPDTLRTDLEQKYNQIGVNSTFLNLRSVQGLYDSVSLLGKKYGKEQEANTLIDEYNEFVSYYREKHKEQEKPKVLVLMGFPGSYLVATNLSYAGSLVELAGGENIFQSETKDFVNINTEELLSRNPDIIIRTCHGLKEEAKAMFQDEFSTNDIWKHFKAVKNEKVFDIDNKICGISASFDYPKALSDLEEMLYGE